MFAGNVRVRFVRNGFVEIRVEGLTFRLDALDAFRLEHRLELARDQLDPTRPRIVHGTVLQGALQIVQHGQHLLEDDAFHVGARDFLIAHDAILVVDEFRALALQVSAMLRDFGLGAQVLADLGVRRIRLLSNNPKKIAGIGGYGLEVVERVPIEAAPSSENVGWLRERREREGHLLRAVRGGPSED